MLLGTLGLPKWFYAVAVFYAVQSSVGSYVKLYILQLGGNAVSVSLAVTAFSVAIIPAAVLAGGIADYITRRRSILIVSSIGQLVSLLMIGVSRDIGEITVLYAGYSFFCNLSPTIFSLLMLETAPKSRWGKGRDLILRNMIYGNILGLLVSELVIYRYPLESMSFLPAALSALMLGFSLFWIRDPPMTLERRTLSLSSDELVDRLAQLPLSLFKAPAARDFRRLLKSARNTLTRDVPLLILSMNLFHLGSNLFTSSYTPFLRGNGLSNFEILGLDIFLAVINALAILNRFSDVSRMGDPAVPVEFFMLRGIAFLLGGLGSLYLLGRPALYLTLLLYLLMGLANTNIVIGMNKLIYDKLPAGGEGGTLGVYSSLNNFCILVGSLVSGSISLLFGFHVTFFLASLVLFISATAVEWHFHPKRVWDDDPYE